MKLQLLLPILLLAITSSCSSDNEKTLENELDNTRYYVKYECELNTQHLNIVKTISFTTENGNETINTTDMSWEGTYGPLKKGTTVHLDCQIPSNYQYSRGNFARIYVSREKEPFVIKAEDSGKHNISLSYTIDF